MTGFLTGLFLIVMAPAPFLLLIAAGNMRDEARLRELEELEDEI
jgi:uncharacterized membrane protein YbaN (DUF454 family)